MKHSVLSILALAMLSACATGGVSFEAPEPPAAWRIERDQWGVPTITGQTDPATAYGLAYAHAEDDFPSIQRQLLAVRGRLGEVDGPEGAKADYFGRLIDVDGQVAAGLDRVPEAALAMARGYADGLNAYAARHPDEVLLGGVFPVSERDIIGGFVLVSPLFFGVDDVVGRLIDGRPLGADPARERGSNAFAIAPSRMADGSTVLISNSHQPWLGPAAWYEARIRSLEGWSMSGATFPGSPVILMGHNEHLGWTNTVNRPDLVDVYRLELDRSGRRYRYDGEWRTLDREVVWLRVRMGPATVPVRKVLWRSVHGPVVKTERGAFAIRYAGMGETRQLAQYYALNLATSLPEWRAVMGMQAIPATNFIYADREGNIALLYNARFPRRDASIDWSGILPGDRPELVWDAYLGAEEIPFLLNPPSGYIVNANNTPFLATTEGAGLDRAAFADFVGIEPNITNRILRSIALLDADETLTEDDLERIKFDKAYDRASPIGQGVEHLLATPPGAGSAEIHALLAGWDWTLDGEGRADAAAALVIDDVYRALRRREPLPEAEATLAKAAAHLTEHFGRLDPALGDLVRLRRGTADLPLLGGPDALRAIGWTAAPDGRLVADFGDSFVMWVKWDREGEVSARSIYPFGAAVAHPGSAHHADQAPLFANEGWKPAPLPPVGSSDTP
jgi:acyl-homoserine-lactone acylase